MHFSCASVMLTSFTAGLLTRRKRALSSSITLVIKRSSRLVSKRSFLSLSRCLMSTSPLWLNTRTLSTALILRLRISPRLLALATKSGCHISPKIRTGSFRMDRFQKSISRDASQRLRLAIISTSDLLQFQSAHGTTRRLRFWTKCLMRPNVVRFWDFQQQRRMLQRPTR